MLPVSAAELEGFYSKSREKHSKLYEQYLALREQLKELTSFREETRRKQQKLEKNKEKWEIDLSEGFSQVRHLSPVCGEKRENWLLLERTAFPKAEIALAEAEYLEKHEELRRFASRVTQCQQRLAALPAQRESLQQQLSHLEREITAVEEKKIALKQDLALAKRELEQARSRRPSISSSFSSPGSYIGRRSRLFALAEVEESSDLISEDVVMQMLRASSSPKCASSWKPGR